MPQGRPLRIAVLSKSDASGGGASRVAEDVVSVSNRLGHTATHFVGWSRNPQRRRFNGGSLRSAVTMRLHGLGRRAGLAESVPWELPSVLSTLERFAPDVVHVHDTSTALAPGSLAAIGKRYPTLWTFHDCSAFTGGCLYPGLHDCARYLRGCGSCPARGEWPVDGVLDTSALALALRRKLHSTGHVAPVAPSRWMADLADGSGMLGRPTRVIANCVDTENFRPSADRMALRRKLGLPVSKPVIVTSAGNVGDRRKGIPDAVRAIRASGVHHLVLLGQPDPRLGPLVEGLDVVATGYVSERAHLAEWLSASDAFAFCSTADNQPLGILEAMACGVPVFSYATGGIPECVDDSCGGIARPGDIDGLAGLLASALASGSLTAMGRAARDRILRDHGLDRFASAHIDAYRSEIAFRNLRCSVPASLSTAAS